MKEQTRRRAYLREARVTLLLARVAVHVLPARWLFDWAGRAPRINRFAIDEADWIAWAIGHAGTGARTKPPCLPLALAAHAMLRRRGIASKLCLGVARNGSDLAAHAWIEVGARKLVGGEEAAQFSRLAVFDGAA